MNRSMIFTVTDTDNAGKPIVWAQSASSYHKDNQEACERLVQAYLDSDHNAAGIPDEPVKDIAYGLRMDGYFWTNERFCFELTEVWG